MGVLSLTPVNVPVDRMQNIDLQVLYCTFVADIIIVVSLSVASTVTQNRKHPETANPAMADHTRKCVILVLSDLMH